MKKTAILIDGGFFIKRIEYFLRKFFNNQEVKSDQLMLIIWRIVKYHIDKPHGRHTERKPLELYRIFFYDCEPHEKQVKYPLPEQGNLSPSTKNFKTHKPYVLRKNLHKELSKNRKTALRLGRLSSTGQWKLADHVMKELISKKKTWDQLTNNDFYYEVKQKAIDIKLGMDITTLAMDKLVDVIILLAGDSDFVPAAKFARTKGIDFILDPMESNIEDGLSLHIDGVQSCNVIKAIHEICHFDINQEKKPEWWDKYKNNHQVRQQNQSSRIRKSKQRRVPNHPR